MNSRQRETSKPSQETGRDFSKISCEYSLAKQTFSPKQSNMHLTTHLGRIVFVWACVTMPCLVTAEPTLDDEQIAHFVHTAMDAVMAETADQVRACHPPPEPVAGLPSTSIRIVAPGHDGLESQTATGASADVSLAAMVEAFNAKAADDPTGQGQPPITVDEVVAAIRGWIPDLGPDIDDATFDRYQQIAETGVVPPGTVLGSMTRWHGYRGFVFQVWWVDLNLPSDGEGFHGYTFRLRDIKIASRPLTEAEATQRLSEEERFRAKLKELSPQAFAQIFPDEVPPETFD
ncbi:MAG: hypothetical protein AAF328_04535 [Planctomycetota bacterium]